jgi:hypothetical protein
MLEKDEKKRFNINEVEEQLKEIMKEKMIFISYSHDDKEIVHKLAIKLKELIKEPIWIDIYGLRKGDNINKEIADAIANSSLFIPFISENYCRSEPCQMELEFAQIKKRKIIPIMLKREIENNQIEFIINRLNQFQAFKITDLDNLFEAMYKHIIRIIYEEPFDNTNEG